jgi:hypothetical protein
MSWLWRRMKRIRMILMIAGILKGDECLLRNTSGNVKIANFYLKKSLNLMKIILVLFSEG